MYAWIRKLHLLLGLSLVLFLLMYGVSAVQMAHPDWFDLEPTVTEAEVPVAADVGPGARAVARHLMQAHGLRGELMQVREEEGGYRFRIVRPGTVYEVHYAAAERTAHVRTNVANFIGMLNRIHHLGGVRHEYALLNVWGVFVFLASAGLILLGLSGVYLWFRLHRKRRVLGAVLLAGSIGFSVTLMILLRAA